MSGPIQISLKAGERIYLNGAVVRSDRKVTLQLLNEVVFILESHVMQAEETTTPLRQLYFVVQALLMDPRNADATRDLFRQMHASTMASFTNDAIRAELVAIARAGRRRPHFRGAEDGCVRCSRARTRSSTAPATAARRAPPDRRKTPMTTVSSVSSTGTTATTATHVFGQQPRLQRLSQAAHRPAQEPGSDPADGFDPVRRAARHLLPGRAERTTNSKLDSLLTAQSLTIGRRLHRPHRHLGRRHSSGVVTSVKITSDGPVATLDNGDTLTLGAGVTIQ